MNSNEDAYCRLCAELKPLNQLTNLQTDEEMSQDIVNKLSRFNIELHANVLPETVCLVCTKSLDRAFAFVTAVEQAQETLSDFILVQSDNDQNASNDSTDKSKENVIIGEDDFYVSVKIEDYNSAETEQTCRKPDEEDIYVRNQNSNEESLDLDNDNIVEDVNEPYSETEKNCRKPDKEDIYVRNQNSNEESLDVDNDNIVENVNEPYLSDEYKTNKHKNSFDEHPTVKRKLSKKIETTNSIPLNKSFSSCEKTSHSFERLPYSVDNVEHSAEYISKQIEKLQTIPLQEIKTTWLDFTWTCSYCELQYQNIQELQKHSMECHSTCNAYQCSECNFKRSNLKLFIKHVSTHFRYFHYSCFMCSKKFSNPYMARKHKLTHYISKFICQGCNTSFANKDLLKEHETTFYKLMCEKKVPDRSSDGYLKCNVCPKSYKSANGFARHMLIHTDRKKEHVCEICGKDFYDKHFLRFHVFTHSDERPHQCEICKFNFKSMNRLRYHIRNVHSAIKPFTCDNCGKCFRTKSCLTGHMAIHSDLKPYSCTCCDKTFRTKTMLKNHLPQHTGVRAYSCDVCSRDFVDVRNRNKHMRRKHGIFKVKRVNTGQGPLAVDPTSGIIYPETDKLLELKQKMQEPIKRKNIGRRKNIKKI